MWQAPGRTGMLGPLNDRTPTPTAITIVLLVAGLMACAQSTPQRSVTPSPNPGGTASGRDPQQEDNLDPDQDGIPLANDQCPEMPEDIDGFEDADGCPDEDNDADGVPDIDDLCPNEATHRSGPRQGPGIDAPGCPTGETEYRDGPPGDLDNDGYPDDVDACPVHAETFPSGLDGSCTDDGDGCPDGGHILLIACEIEILEVIHFDARRATIGTTGGEVVSAIAAVLAEHPELRLEVVGHIDDRERGALGQTRADAVRAALVAAGVDPARLTTRDAAATQPLVPVAGLRGPERSEARARNRRVEFEVIHRRPLYGRPSR